MERHVAPPLIETPRLRGERIRLEHQGELDLVLSGAPWREAIEPHVEHWEVHGFGYWMFFDRASGEPVARGGPRTTHVGGRDEVELAWSVVPARWGQGYATEIGAASVRVAFGDLGLPDVVAYTMVDNIASRRVMEKLGFGYEREVVHADLPHVLYRLQRDSTSDPGPPSSRSSPSPP
jgi:ribosomal-protein-alanine N-acetyltransferase